MANKSTGLAGAMQGKGVKINEKLPPLWKGPEVDGITQSMLGDFLNCRERFRVKYVLGLQPNDDFNHRIEYGNMWHICEECYASGSAYIVPDWEAPLRVYAQELGRRYPLQQESIRKYYLACKVQFPIYVAYWGTHPDVRKRTPIYEEERFKVPYPLPSGRVVLLRGKLDSVDLVATGDRTEDGIYLQENKAKGDIKEQSIKAQLGFDLQTMIYLTALTLHKPNDSSPFIAPLRGVRYNVIRRPFSGGRGSITPHKEKRPAKGKYVAAETESEFYARLGAVFTEAPQDFFFRWRCLVSEKEIETFQHQFLIPILEEVCDWYNHVTTADDPFAPVEGGQEDGISYPPQRSIHWRHPYGVYNPMNEGYEGDVDAFLATGNKVGLRRVERLFTELE